MSGPTITNEQSNNLPAFQIIYTSLFNSEVLQQLPRGLGLLLPPDWLPAVLPRPQPARRVLPGGLQPSGRLQLCPGDLPEREQPLRARLAVPLLRGRHGDPPRTDGLETGNRVVREHFQFDHKLISNFLFFNPP